MIRSLLAAIVITLNAPLYAQQWQWARKANVTQGTQMSKDVCVDKAGNVYMIGHNDTTTIYGNNTLDRGSFIAKYSNAGSLIWTKHIPGSVQSLITDSYDNIFLAGNFSGVINLNSLNYYSNGESDIYLMKLSPQGHLNWIKTFGGIGEDAVRSIKTDHADNLYMIGSFQDSISFDGHNVKKLASFVHGLSSFFLLKINANGNTVWVRTCTHNHSNNQFYYYSAVFLAVDKNAAVYITGGSVKYPGFYSQAYGHHLLKYDSSGTLLMDQRPWSVHQRQYGLAVDDSLNILIEHGPSQHSSSGRVLVKYGPSFNLKWYRSMGNYWYNTNYTFGYGLSVDKLCNIYLGGMIGCSDHTDQDSVFLCDQWVLSKTTTDLLVGKFDPQGDCIWINTAGGEGEDNYFDIAHPNTGPGMYIDQFGNCYLTGTFNSSVRASSVANDPVVFGNDTLITDGEWQHIYLAKIQSANPIIQSLKEERIEKEISIYPNPADNKLVFTLTEKRSEPYEIETMNLFGEIIKTIEVQANESNYEMNVEDMPNGVYFCCLRSKGKRTSVKKIIIDR